ncbi:unnamed protein product [Phytophthora fragariaefolia]|uniref:Unnamed protein product n=1 Tax=Phytophthora fragariaefolia TaxID=1490495 RepID=A0A9W6XZL0_9STRA|nr:unnamed protein product [Phytophthora fragariaefolia]
MRMPLFRRGVVGWLLCAGVAHAELAEVAPSPQPETSGVSAEQAAMLAADALFLFVGVVYGSRVLAPKPMTYLSEIAFPLDVSAEQLEDRWLRSLTGADCGVCAVLRQAGGVVRAVPAQRAAVAVPGGFQLVAAVPSPLRSRPAERAGYDGDAGLGEMVDEVADRRERNELNFCFAVWRLFWFIKWLDATYFLVTNGTFAGASRPEDEGALSYMTSMVFGGVCYAASLVLMLFICVRPTTITPEFIAYPTEVNTPSAYLNPTSCQPPTSLYGSFKDWELMNYVSAITEKAKLDITIPSTTSSIWGNKQFVSFKIVVQTDEDHWTLRRPYSDFAALDEEVLPLFYNILPVTIEA